MSKIAKRTSPPTRQAKRRRLRASAPRPRPTGADRAAAGAGGSAIVVEGQVVAVVAASGAGGKGAISGAPGSVRAVLSGGEAIDARCPVHVDIAWLSQACVRGPVAAVFVAARPSGRYVLWGLFPGAEHADVRADLIIRGRKVRVDAESLQLSSQNAHLDLESDGNVALKGRDITSHARRVHRIKGGSIRLN
jgi:hypothetical protein